jgi:hypothetical protein
MPACANVMPGQADPSWSCPERCEFKIRALKIDSGGLKPLRSEHLRIVPVIEVPTDHDRPNVYEDGSALAWSDGHLLG